MLVLPDHDPPLEGGARHDAGPRGGWRQPRAHRLRHARGAGKTVRAAAVQVVVRHGRRVLQPRPRGLAARAEEPRHHLVLGGGEPRALHALPPHALPLLRREDGVSVAPR